MVWERILPGDVVIPLQGAFFRHGNMLETSPPRWKSCQLQRVPVHELLHVALLWRLACWDASCDLWAESFLGFCIAWWLCTLGIGAWRSTWHWGTKWSGSSFSICSSIFFFPLFLQLQQGQQHLRKWNYQMECVLLRRKGVCPYRWLWFHTSLSVITDLTSNSNWCQWCFS